MRFIGSAVNRVPGALCRKFNHKVTGNSWNTAQVDGKDTEENGGGKKKPFKSKHLWNTYVPGDSNCPSWRSPTTIEMGHLAIPKKGHPGIARFFKGCLGDLPGILLLQASTERQSARGCDAGQLR